MTAPKETVCKPLNTLGWWACFLLATVLMSQWFHTFKALLAAPTLANALVWLGVMTALTLVVVLLGYDSYVQAKGKGEVQRPIRLMDWMMEKRFLLKGDLK